jgi:hypothetical protein
MRQNNFVRFSQLSIFQSQLGERLAKILDLSEEFLFGSALSPLKPDFQ